ncbi:uncharacterized protein EV420DRAFT_1682330 [Desarmillaria tabescens]|uniref:Uncharacterized protein n=1 Tax=Armillaria tabescens TaxID=1929756 RepID=A0AA39N545_ARMTA|nr:uncharacterized protein EV420DRAFT_1682330 [Desarmillaria tabescens]KAK0458252.1 hypothetical protein EV420DRAFT_1682330 [Desarmillaria tabescens]
MSEETVSTHWWHVLVKDRQATDKRTLGACALIAKVWTVPSQILLFRRITITTSSNLCVNPCLLRYTRHLITAHSPRCAVDSLVTYTPNVKHITVISSLISHHAAQVLGNHGHLSSITLRTLTNPSSQHLSAILSALGPSLQHVRFEVLKSSDSAMLHEPVVQPLRVATVDLIECDLKWFGRCPVVSFRNLHTLQITIIHNAEHEELTRFMYGVDMVENLVVTRRGSEKMNWRIVSYMRINTRWRVRRVEVGLSSIYHAVLVDEYLSLLDTEVTEEICVRVSKAVLVALMDGVVWKKGFRNLKRYRVTGIAAASVRRDEVALQDLEYRGAECIMD